MPLSAKKYQRRTSQGLVNAQLQVRRQRDQRPPDLRKQRHAKTESDARKSKRRRDDQAHHAQRAGGIAVHERNQRAQCLTTGNEHKAVQEKNPHISGETDIEKAKEQQIPEQQHQHSRQRIGQ